jgi:hypothetical protein
MSVNIHGKEYITVAERLTEARDHIKTITTEVLFQSPVVIKATVTTDKGTFTGISAANDTKAIEKQSPYEVAETSAVGRALGFAGYGIVEGIATADEMAKTTGDEPDGYVEGFSDEENLGNCKKCGAPNAKSLKGNIYCSDKCWLK